jgi:hypothetical protein
VFLPENPVVSLAANDLQFGINLLSTIAFMQLNLIIICTCKSEKWKQRVGLESYCRS